MKQQCIFCKSDSIVKNGLRKRKVRTKQSFLCLSCRKQFVEPDGFERMRHQKEDIMRAIHLHSKGLSLFDAKDHPWQHDGGESEQRNHQKMVCKIFCFFKIR